MGWNFQFPHPQLLGEEHEKYQSLSPPPEFNLVVLVQGLKLQAFFGSNMQPPRYRLLLHMDLNSHGPLEMLSFDKQRLF